MYVAPSCQQLDLRRCSRSGDDDEPAARNLAPGSLPHILQKCFTKYRNTEVLMIELA